MLARRGGGNEENDVRPRYARVSEEDGETMRVAILGGGCAGSSLAYYLARGGCSCMCCLSLLHARS